MGSGKKQQKKKNSRWMFPSVKQPRPLLRDPEVLMRLAGHRVGRDGLRHVISPLSGGDNSDAAEFITLRSAAGDG